MSARLAPPRGDARVGCHGHGAARNVGDEMNPAPRLDTRFLTLHPVTAKWWQQRKQCMSCKHFSDGEELTFVHRSERCNAYKPQRVHRGPTPPELCIDARATAADRDDGLAGLCGPDAVLFEPKEVGAA